MKKKIILIGVWLLTVLITAYNFSDISPLIPKFRPFGSSTTFADSTNFVTLTGKGLLVYDSVKVGRWLSVGTTNGGLYLDTNKSGQLYFTGLSLSLANTKNKGFMYFSCNQSFSFNQDISGSLSEIATLDTNGLIIQRGVVQFDNITTTLRDLKTPANGMVIYNSTDDKLQVYSAGSWVNLH